MAMENIHSETYSLLIEQCLMRMEGEERDPQTVVGFAPGLVESGQFWFLTHMRFRVAYVFPVVVQLSLACEELAVWNVLSK